MKTFIVLLPTDNNDRKKQANAIQDEMYDTYQHFANASGCKNALVYDLDNFMEQCNDEAINLNDYWVTYIRIKNQSL